MKDRYVCVEDYQTGDWCVGTSKTIEGWRRLAMSWADSDGNDGVLKTLKALYGKGEEVIDFISDFWQIRIVKERTC